MDVQVEKALIVDEPWTSEILKGRKTWEMRRKNWSYRGLIGLIRKGSGLVVGVVELVGCRPALGSLEAYAAAEDKHGIPPARQARAFANGWRIPWELRSAQPLRTPVRYAHPSGAVITVNLDPAVTRTIAAQLRDEAA